MIARTWRGATKAEDAERYLEYLHTTGFRSFRETPGNLGAFGLRRIVDGRAVFLIISLWESEDAIRRFAGDDIERAVFFPEDDRFLVERDDRVEHFDVVHQASAASVG
jgi:heme-degrading monooxygenase HmoA